MGGRLSVRDELTFHGKACYVLSYHPENLNSLYARKKQTALNMDTPQLHERINRQITAACRQYGLPAQKLTFSTHIFKPDSPKLETVVAVDVGRGNRRTRLKSSIRSFYSPGLYRCESAAELEKDIQAHLTRSVYSNTT